MTARRGSASARARALDALYWQVNSATARKSIGEMTYGLGEKADGVFVVVDLKVRSAKSESVVP